MKTKHLKRWSKVNQAWLTWRDDCGIQSGVRIWPTEAEADQDIRDRDSFLQQVMDHKFNQESYYNGH